MIWVRLIKKRVFLVTAVLTAALFSLCGCKNNTNNTVNKGNSAKIEITVFAAKSLNNALDDIIEKYKESHENVEFIANYDGSGTLTAQIEEGATCDLFFSAAEKQMDMLEEDNLIISDTRKDIVKNKVCIVTKKGGNTKVTCINNLYLAENLAIADGSVPVGKYTRQALVNAGVLSETDDVSKITTQEISNALNNVEINECANVGAVASSVLEGINEVGTVYYSDTFNYGDQLEIIEMLETDLTGDVIYPAAIIKNSEATKEQIKCTEEFLEYLVGDEAKEIFESYKFITD